MDENRTRQIEGFEGSRLQELEARYQKLLAWAKEQEFVTVYRAEGDPSWSVDRSGTPELRGTWYTEQYPLIAGHKSNIEGNSGMPAKVYALTVPKSLLETRDELTKGMSEVNVLNKDLLAGRKEIVEMEDANEPTLDNYLNQFDFVREYLALTSKGPTKN